MILQEQLEVLFFKLKICFNSSRIDQGKFKFITSLVKKISLMQNKVKVKLVLQICDFETQNAISTYKYLLKLINYILLEKNSNNALDFKGEIIDYINEVHQDKRVQTTRWWEDSMSDSESLKLSLLILLSIDYLELSQDEHDLLVNCFMYDGFRRSKLLFTCMSDEEIKEFYYKLKSFKIQEELIYISFIEAFKTASLPLDIEISPIQIKQTYLLAKSHGLKNTTYLLIPIVHKMYSPMFM